MTIDKLESQVEKLTERVRLLSYPFADAELQKEADDARDEIVDLLENYLELATQDWETRPNSDEEET